jgi:hypothetical protein
MTTCWGNNMPREKWRHSRLVCSLAFLSIAAPAAEAGGSFEGDYTGKRVLTNGPANDCPAEDNVSVTIRDHTLTFTNSAVQNYVIPFDPKPDGTFDETHMSVGGDIVAIEGRIAGGALDAEVNNPPCLHHWWLEKK